STFAFPTSSMCLITSCRRCCRSESSAAINALPGRRGVDPKYDDPALAGVAVGMRLLGAEVEGVAGLKAIGGAVQGEFEIALEHVADFLAIVRDDSLCLASGLLNHQKALKQVHSTKRDAVLDGRTVFHPDDVPFPLAEHHWRLLLLLVGKE